MKPKDYMIGDILIAHLDDGEQVIDFPVVIDGLDENGTLVDGHCFFSWKPLNKEHAEIESANDLSPIPLTEGMLLSNGWVKKRDGWDDYYVRNERPSCLISTDTDERFSPTVYTIGGYKPINYVHELQHMLRFGGLNDLANKFKL